MATDESVFQHGTVEQGKRQSNGQECCKTGPGYASPLEAMSGPREQILYVTSVYSGTLFHFWDRHQKP